MGERGIINQKSGHIYVKENLGSENKTLIDFMWALGP